MAVRSLATLKGAAPAAGLPEAVVPIVVVRLTVVRLTVVRLAKGAAEAASRARMCMKDPVVADVRAIILSHITLCQVTKFTLQS